MPANKKKSGKHRIFWNLSSHAGKTTFFIKNTSEIIPKILPKTVQNTSKIEPKRVPKQFRTPSRKYAAPTSLKSPKRAQKMTSKRSLISEKHILGSLFFSSKKGQFSEAFFSLFLLSPGGPGPWKSSQNTVRVCKNEGPTFSHKNLDFIKTCTKNDLPLDPQNLTKTEQKLEEGPSKTDLKKQ